ncbi:MAG TPA: DUF2585 family protein [Pyrinomonadaceae bacterium]|nr:DUF2585 family protein [Pyrinomonadaceae bacterium]
MPADYIAPGRKLLWPGLITAAVLAATALVLHAEGRLWLCSCGYLLLWTGNAWSADNSQHLSDPYSFTHVLHGFIFCWLLWLLFPRWKLGWRFVAAISIEALWEVFENSAYVIERYRAATAALGYQGDTVVNSLGDILFCAAGFLLAERLGFRRSLIIFFLTEAVLLILIRDSLLLNILMLLYPLDSIKAWQAGH